MAVCLGEGREGVKNQNVEDISSQQIDTGPLIPASLFLPPGHDLHCKCKFCRIGLFLESEKNGWWREGEKIGGSYITLLLL